MTIESTNYVVATIRPWNLQQYHSTIKHFPGHWHLIEQVKDLTIKNLLPLRPMYIFFPHWSSKVPLKVLQTYECVCFHEADIPYGRGGSPIQNMIAAGLHETVVTALKKVEEFDAGPVYLKRSLSLEGLGEEIFLRSSAIIADMIKYIITHNPIPVPQTGKATVFARRKPSESKLPTDATTLMELFSHIRMLDCAEYPKAFFEIGKYRFELTRPALRTDHIAADVKITLIEKEAE